MLISLLKKLGNRSQALKAVGTYTLISFFSKAVSFLLILVYTQPQFMSPEDNGLVNLFSSSIVFLMPVLSMGTLQSVSTEYFKLSKEEFKNFFTNIFFLPLLVMLLSMVFFFFARNYMKINYGFPYFFALLIPLATFTTYLYEQITVVLRSTNDLKKFTTIGLTKMFLEFGLSIILVVFFAMRWQGRLTGILVAGILIGAYGIYYFKQKGFLSGAFNKKYLKNEISFALPVIALQAGIFCLNSSDKFILADLAENNAVVGVYGIACAFATVIIIFSGSYLGYLFPDIYKALSAEKTDYKKIKKNFFQYLVTITIVASLLIVATPSVYKYLINEKYHSAVNYFHWLVLGYFFWAIASFFYSFLLYYKNKRSLFLLSFFIIIVTLTLNYLFTRNFGVRGTAMGVMISYFIALALIAWFTRKHIILIFGKSE